MTVDWAALSQQGIAGLMFVTFILGLLKEYWVLGREYRAMRDDRDYWRDAAGRQLDMAGRGLDLTETAVTAKTKRGPVRARD